LACQIEGKNEKIEFVLIVAKQISTVKIILCSTANFRDIMVTNGRSIYSILNVL
jgi:hypothetical protein